MTTSALTNVITDPSGSPVVGAVIVATLRPGPGFRISNSSEIAGVEQTISDGAGAWSLTLERNADIYPAGSYWRIEEHIPDIYGGAKVWNVTVGVANANVRASLITELPPGPTPEQYLTQTQGDARYETPPGATTKVANHNLAADAHIGTLERLGAATDGLLYVAPTGGLDANDGLSRGSAKLTLAAAVAALEAATGGTIEVLRGQPNIAATVNPGATRRVRIVGVGRDVTDFRFSAITALNLVVPRCTVADLRLFDTVGSAASVAIAMGDGVVGTTQWVIDRVDLRGTGNLGKGLRCNNALSSSVNDCNISFFDKGVELVAFSNAISWVGNTIRQNNIGVEVASSCENNSFHGGVIEGNNVGIKMLLGSGLLSCFGVHFEQNLGADPTDVRIEGGVFKSFGCGYYAVLGTGTPKAIRVTASSTANHLSVGDALNAGIEHNGTGIFTIIEPQDSVVTLTGTGPTILVKNGSMTCRNFTGFAQVIAGFALTDFGQPLRNPAGTLDLRQPRLSTFAGDPRVVVNGDGTVGIVDVDLNLYAVGKGLRIAEGANAKQGVATLVAGTVTVANTSVTATSRILLTSQDNAVTGALRVSARTAGTSFVITSNVGADAGVVAYEIFQPA